MPRTKEQDRIYQRERRERMQREKSSAAPFALHAVKSIVEPAGAAPPPVVQSEAGSAPPAGGAHASAVAAVRAQLALVPAEQLALHPILASTMLSAARILDDPASRHMHAANIRELRTSLERATAASAW